MNSVVGLGKLGCKLAEAFEGFGNYTIFKIDIGLPKTKNTRGIPKQNNVEGYEENCPSMKYFFKGMRGNSTLILSGGEPISAASLRILEAMNHKETTVIYIQPDIKTLNETSRLQENVVFNVLQEYARSGVLKKIVLISTENVEKAMGDVPIIGYEDTFRSYIANSLNLINYFEHSEPVMSADSEKVDHSRIMTIGLVDFSDGEEKVFFELEGIKERMYYYGINEDKLRNDNKMISKIREQIDAKRAGEQRTSYRIYSTTYDEPHVFCIQSSLLIQKRVENS